LLEFTSCFEGTVSQLKDFVFVVLPLYEAFKGGTDAGDGGYLVFADFGSVADVDEQAVLINDAFDDEAVAFGIADGFAFTEANALQHAGVAGVEALFVGGGEEDANAVRIDAGDDTEAEFRFGFAQAALADVIEFHRKNSGVMSLKKWGTAKPKWRKERSHRWAPTEDGIRHLRSKATKQ